MFINLLSGNKDESEQTSLVRDIDNSRVLSLKAELLEEVETVYSPQSFEVFSSCLGFHKLLQQQLTDVALSKIEGLAALYLALSEVSSAKGFTAVLTLYAKTHSQASLITQLKDIADGLFSDLTPQDSESRPQWLNQMITGLTDWKLLTASPAFRKISRVLSLMVTMGVVDSCPITLGNFELFAVRAYEKQVSAVDFIDALIETTVFFAEGAYQCFLQGSIRPLFFSSSEVVQIEEAYIEKVAEFEFARNGNLQKFKGKSESQFDKELTALIEKLNELYKTMPAGAEKKIVQTKWEALSKMSAEFAAIRVKGGLRKAPYFIKVYGESGVGKSTFADLAMATVLKANGFPASSDYVVTLNDKEKHMSTYRSYVTGIKMDDFGNTKMDFWEHAPSDWIIKICNNIREAAIMADVANKGKITIEPKCFTITTNVKDLHAGKTSNCPKSILRRPNVHVDLKVRPEFRTDGMLDSHKVVETFGSLDKVNDIWLIDIVEPEFNGDIFNSWHIVKENMSVHQFLDYLVEDSRKHFKTQDVIVDSFKEPSNIVNFCPECNNIDSSCTCDIEPQFGERIANVIKTKTDSLRVRTHYHSHVLSAKAEDLAVSHLLKAINKWENSLYSKWTNWIPTPLLDNDLVKSVILWSAEDYIAESVSNYTKKFILMGLCVCWIVFQMSARLSFFTALILTVFFLCCYAGVIEAKKEAYFKAVVAQNGSLHEAFMSARDKHVHYACGLLASLGVLYGAAQVVKALRRSLSTQGSLKPRSVEEVQQRDSEANPWARNAAEPVVVSSENSFTNVEEASAAMFNSIGRIEVNNKFSVCFMVQTNKVMVPKHFLPEESSIAEIIYAKRRFRFILNPKYYAQVGLADFVVIYVPNTGPLKNTVPFFLDDYSNHPLVCRLYGLRADGTRYEDLVTWNQVPDINNGYLTAPGSHYRTQNIPTFSGMCMSVIVRDAKRTQIVGFHVGGVAGSDKGCGMTCLRRQLESACARIENQNKIFMCGTQASEMPDVILGQKVAVSPEVHPKCPSNYIESENAAVLVYGSVVGRTAVRSNVIETPISKTVEEVTGVSNQWGPPKFETPVAREDGSIDQQRWKPWYESLAVSSQPSVGFDPELVEHAMDDYLADLKVNFDELGDMWKNEMRPLSEIEVVSGIDGRRFVDSMNASTSMGWPINKKKSNFLVDLPPTKEHACPRTFVPEIWDKYHAFIEQLKEGNCGNSVFGASLKDEATKLTKEKVRVFQACNTDLGIGLRTYFLPVSRFLSVNPLVSECAVGINAQGSEWHELSEFMSKFGDDRIIAGDYSKYDLRMPQQLTITAFRAMIEIAKWSGNYTGQDIKIMEGLAFEVCSPLVAYNGTLMRFMGTNPSGQNMTVYVNSIVNSLLHRLAFFDAYGNEDLDEIGRVLGLGRRATFRDLVALMTYGDDAKGSVRPGYDKFNHVSMANFLAKNDMKFTMPDKESAPVEFMNRYQADFLKRKDVFNPDLNKYVGQLDENSIFKSLHSILKSKAVSPLETSRMNIEGALREWFFYGEDHFNLRQTQMQKIAAKCGIESEQMDKSYAQRVEEWLIKYDPQSGEIISSGQPQYNDPEHPIYDGVRYSKRVRRIVSELAEASEERLRAIVVEAPLVGTPGAHCRANAANIVLKYRRCVPVDVWDLSTHSFSSLDDPEPVDTEQELHEQVKAILGEPKAEEYEVVGPTFGKGDLLYVADKTILVIECKRVIGRHKSFYDRVVKQAKRYGKVMRDLKPDHTVYCMTYTEHGFEVVDVYGELRFPKKFECVLDNSPVRFD